MGVAGGREERVSLVVWVWAEGFVLLNLRRSLAKEMS